MSSRLRLQKNSSARKKAEQQAALQEQNDMEQAMFASLHGAPPGTAVVVAGRPPDGYIEAKDDMEEPLAAAACSIGSRGQKQTTNVLVSDSDSQDGSENGAEEASDFSTDSESQQSESSASSEEDSVEESPPPAKRGKKTAASTARGSKASCQKATNQQKASAQEAKQVGASSRPASSKRTASTQQKRMRPAAPQTAAGETEETSPLKTRPLKGNAPSQSAQPAMPTIRAASQQAADTSKTPAEPGIASAAAAPSTGNKKEAQNKSHGSLQGASALPRHMTKGIQINSPGPAYRVAGLKRPQGGKPLHQIQPRTS